MQPIPFELAVHILARMGEAGQPPERGIDLVNVGNEEHLEVIDEEYLRPMARSGRGSAFKLVQAHYGGGKTHFLHCVRSRAWRRGFVSALISLSPQDCALDDPGQVWAAVARELELPPVDGAKAPIRGLEGVLRSLPGAPSPGNVLESKVEVGLRTASCEAPALRAAILGFLRALREGDPEREELCLAWLRGEQLSLAELRPLGIRELPGRTTGLRYLRGLCQLLPTLGIPGILLAFDEADRTMALSPRRQVGVADQLRQLIDLCGKESLPAMLCMLAVPPEFFREVVQEYPALQQRLEGPRALSRRSPQAAVIDLEGVGLAPLDLLTRIGQRLLEIFQVARAVSLDLPLQMKNLRVLASEVLAGSFELAHRRTYVKAAIDLLYDQVGAQRLLEPEAARALSGEGGKLLLLPGGRDPFDDF